MKVTEAKPAKRTPGTRYGDAQILKAVIAARGRTNMAALKLGCTTKTIWDAKNRNPEIAQAIKDQREIFIDQAEDALQDAVKDREPWAVCFTLKTIGRERGYVENHGPQVQQVIVQQQGQQDDPFKAAAQTIELLVKQGILNARLFGELPAPSANGTSHPDDKGDDADR